MSKRGRVLRLTFDNVQHRETQIQPNPLTILIHFFDKAFLVDVDSAQVGLVVLLNVHELKHSFASFAHAVVPVSSTSSTGLTVSRDDGDGLDRRQLLCILQVWNQTLLKPPAQGDFASTER